MAVDPGTVRGLFETRLEAIQGTKRAHKYMPSNLRAANCPQWLMVPVEAAHGAETGMQPQFAYHLVAREWRLILILAKASATMPYGNLQEELDVYYKRFEDEFRAHEKLASSDDDLFHTDILSDTGEAIIEFPPTSGQMWFGCEWRIQVWTNRSVTTGD